MQITGSVVIREQTSSNVGQAGVAQYRVDVVIQVLMQDQPNSPNVTIPFIFIVSVVAAVVDWRYKQRGGKTPTKKDRLLFATAVIICAALVIFF